MGIVGTLPESTRRLEAARVNLTGKLAADLGSLSTNAQLARILEWAALLDERAYVVELEVLPQVAHSIFETLNTRGVRLSNGDLAKSFLLARAKNLNLAQNLWRQIIDALKDGAGDYENNLDDFLYHFTGSRYARVSKEQLFKVYSQEAKSMAPLDALEELRVSAELYAGLIDPFAAPALTKYSDEAKYAIQFLNGVKLRQLRYILLAVLRDYPVGTDGSTSRRKAQEELILKIAAWSIRGLVDGRTGGRSAESLYVFAAAAIREGKAKTVAPCPKAVHREAIVHREQSQLPSCLRTSEIRQSAG